MSANNEEYKLVEVLSEDKHNKGHLPGAINIPLDTLEKTAKNHLDPSDTIVIYCANYSCQASTKAARLLLEKGYEKTIDFKAGKRGWIHNGLELKH